VRQLTDHLGNIRVVFRKQAGTDNTPEVLSESHYYPFGLELNGQHFNLSGTMNEYKYNSKEQQEQTFNYDYGFRQLDPQLGRWHSPDLLAEQFYSESPYAYAGNNPVSNLDLWGLLPLSWVNTAPGGSHYGGSAWTGITPDIEYMNLIAQLRGEWAVAGSALSEGTVSGRPIDFFDYYEARRGRLGAVLRTEVVGDIVKFWIHTASVGGNSGLTTIKDTDGTTLYQIQPVVIHDQLIIQNLGNSIPATESSFWENGIIVGSSVDATLAIGPFGYTAEGGILSENNGKEHAQFVSHGRTVGAEASAGYSLIYIFPNEKFKFSDLKGSGMSGVINVGVFSISILGNTAVGYPENSAFHTYWGVKIGIGRGYGFGAYGLSGSYGGDSNTAFTNWLPDITQSQFHWR